MQRILKILADEILLHEIPRWYSVRLCRRKNPYISS